MRPTEPKRGLREGDEGRGMYGIGEEGREEEEGRKERSTGKT